ncbi:hypothetical protein EON65_54335, partial [archaeon]
SFCAPSPSVPNNAFGGPAAAADPKVAETRKKLKSQVGNYHYSCPELLRRQGYDHSIDWWAVAVLCFHFVAGITPFEASTVEGTMDNIITCTVNWDALPTLISSEYRSFIAAIITHAEPKHRLGYRSSKEVLRHPFFRSVDFTTLYNDYAPIYPKIKPSGKRPGRGDSTSSFAEQEDEDIEVFASVLSENEASEVAMAVSESMDEKMQRVDEYDNFEGFDCRYV